MFSLSDECGSNPQVPEPVPLQEPPWPGPPAPQETPGPQPWGLRRAQSGQEGGRPCLRVSAVGDWPVTTSMAPRLQGLPLPRVPGPMATGSEPRAPSSPRQQDAQAGTGTRALMCSSHGGCHHQRSAMGAPLKQEREAQRHPRCPEWTAAPIPEARRPGDQPASFSCSGLTGEANPAPAGSTWGDALCPPWVVPLF